MRTPVRVWQVGDLLFVGAACCAFLLLRSLVAVSCLCCRCTGSCLYFCSLLPCCAWQLFHICCVCVCALRFHPLKN